MVVKVVVIGCGLAGSACVSALDGIAKNTPLTIVVVDVRTESISKYAGCRAAALGQAYAYRVTIPNGSIVSEKKGVVINKMVKAIDEQSKLLVYEDDSVETWDILVCATGARNVSPCEPPLSCRNYIDQVEFYDNISTLIRKSSHVTVLGSGAVGTELAGEIKNYYKIQKDVAVLSPGKVLVDGCRYPPPKKFYRRVHKVATKMGIKLYLDQRPINLKLEDFMGRSYLEGRREILTDNGSKFQTDLILLCTGKRLNNQIYPKHWLNENGSIPVKPTLQTTFRPDVYAIGDINDVDETKQGYYAQKQARVAARNIEYVIKQKPNLKEYKPMITTNILIPLGKDVGVSYVGGIILGSMITSRVKGKDLFVKEHWGLYRVKKLLMKEGIQDWRDIAHKTYGKRIQPKSPGGSPFALPNLLKSVRTGPTSRSSLNKNTSEASNQMSYEHIVEMAENGELADESSRSAEDLRLLDPSALSASSLRTGDPSATSTQSALSVVNRRRGKGKAGIVRNPSKGSQGSSRRKGGNKYPNPYAPV